jgi:cell division protein FtsL
MSFFELVTQIILSISIIFLLHQSFIYLRDNYSVRKIKDTTTAAEKYKRIIDDLTQQRRVQDDYELLKQDLEQFLPQMDTI